MKGLATVHILFSVCFAFISMRPPYSHSLCIATSLAPPQLCWRITDFGILALSHSPVFSLDNLTHNCDLPWPASTSDPCLWAHTHSSSCLSHKNCWEPSHYPPMTQPLVTEASNLEFSSILLSFFFLTSNKLPSLIILPPDMPFIHHTTLSPWLLLLTRRSISCLNQWA